MQVNPLNVINLLLATFQAIVKEETPVNTKEIELKDYFEEILLNAMNEFNGIQYIQETTLDFHEPYKDITARIVEDEIQHHLPISPEAPTESCTEDVEDLSFEYKSRAIAYWRSGKKKNLSLESVRQKFKKVRSITQLKRWAGQINRGGTYREKIARICQFTLDNFKAAIDSGHIVHDKDLQRWALRAQQEIGHEDLRFKASVKWLAKFKKTHRIVSRKINKFVTKKTIENAQELNEKAYKFVSEVKRDIEEFGLANIYNSDQSGFQLEMHSGRTMTFTGKKQVECAVQSVESTTHSYTVQPMISGDGKLLSPLFLVLKEPSGGFGPVVSTNLMRPINVHVEPSKSGKVTSGIDKFNLTVISSHKFSIKLIKINVFIMLQFADHFKIWLREVYFPNVGRKSILLLDSWSGHCPKVVQELTPPNKTVEIRRIPVGTTAKIQPLDVYGFRIWKNYVKHFSDNVVLMNHDMNLHLRNNIIKLQSLVHNQLSSPRYVNLFKYSWYAAGYIEERPNDFENPVDFAFGDSCKTQCEHEGCTNVGIVRCSWCKKTLCLKHFFDEYHYCTRYEE